ncbi:putative reverse transcriptase domain-containing protein [Tanacetum coccineum]
MLIDSNKPPDPLFDEFCELTKMTSAEEICSAGAGLILRLLRSTKVSGKARDRVEGSAVDSRGGKRVSSSPLNNEIKEVLADLNLVKLRLIMLVMEIMVRLLRPLLNPSPCSDRENSPVAKSCGLKTSLDSTSMGDVGSIMCGLASSKDGITIAQTGFLNEKGMAGPSFMSNLASMDDVVSAGIGSHSPMDGISCDKDGDKFEFGKISGSKAMLMDKIERKNKCLRKQKIDFAKFVVEVRPITDEERAAKIVKDASNLKGPLEENCNAMGSDQDGFVQVGKNNKPILNPAKDGLYKNIKGGQSRSAQSRGFLRPSQKQDTNQGKGNVGSKWKSNQASSAYVKKSVVQSNSISGTSKDNSNDVLVDDFMVGDDSDINKDKSHVEDFESIWPDLKSEVDILMEAGIYPSKSVRLDWTVNQMDYFYKNCHKYHLDPSYEDEDVESECDGVVMSMRPEFKMDAATDMENDAAQKKLASICSRVLGRWEWASNNASSNGGTRIIVGWDPNCVNVMIMEQSAQVIHCFVEPLNGDLSFHCSFIYAHIHTVDRRSLWKSLRKYKRSLRDSPWIILGDFNTTLNPSEKSSGCSKVTTAMSDFRDCVAEIEVDDISMSGLNFTWNKSPGKVGGLLKKLDRVMGNVAFVIAFPTSYAHFLPFMTSDHTPAVFAIPEVAKAKPKPFKFHNYLTGKDGFIPAVKKVWDSEVKGFSMFSLVSKLKILKKPLRKLNFDQGNLFANVERLRQELASIQAAMVFDPFSSDLREAKLLCLKSFKEALKDGELFLRQKSKIEWLSEGDCNSKYFHNVVKGRINKGRISVVEDMCGIPHFGSSVGDAVYMIRDISDNEIKAVLFDIDNNKAPGVDGKLLKESVSVLKNSLDEFGSVSGLFPSFPKAWCSLVMLYVNDCSMLVDKVKKRILDWKNKSLSFAGRLQLILSVVGSMQVYWSSMFILPIIISNEVERLMRDFLWNYGDFKRGKVRIKWADVYKPKVEGGIGRNFWDILEKEGSSWSWKKILRYRGVLRSHIVHRIGNGLDTSLWFDNWHAICTLSEFISKRKMYYSGLSLDCEVANERNVRMFQDKSRSVESLTCLIKDTVRLRIMSVSLNDSPQVSKAAYLWNFHVDRGLIMKPMNCVIYFGYVFPSSARWVFSFGLQAHVKKTDWIKVRGSAVCLDVFVFFFVFALCIELMLAGLELVYGDASMGVWLVLVFLYDSEYSLFLQLVV